MGFRRGGSRTQVRPAGQTVDARGRLLRLVALQCLQLGTQLPDLLHVFTPPTEVPTDKHTPHPRDATRDSGPCLIKRDGGRHRGRRREGHVRQVAARRRRSRRVGLLGPQRRSDARQRADHLTVWTQGLVKLEELRRGMIARREGMARRSERSWRRRRRRRRCVRKATRRQLQAGHRTTTRSRQTLRRRGGTSAGGRLGHALCGGAEREHATPIQMPRAAGPQRSRLRSCCDRPATRAPGARHAELPCNHGGREFALACCEQASTASGLESLSPRFIFGSREGFAPSRHTLLTHYPHALHTTQASPLNLAQDNSLPLCLSTCRHPIHTEIAACSPCTAAHTNRKSQLGTKAEHQ